MNLGFYWNKDKIIKAGIKLRKPIVRAGRMKPVHSDIRGPLFVEAIETPETGDRYLKIKYRESCNLWFLSRSDSIKKRLMEHHCRTVSATVTSKECLRQDRQSVIMRPVKGSKVSRRMTGDR